MNKQDKATILLVDNKPANLLTLKNLISGKDRIILNTSEGEAALKISFNKDIDLIILNTQLPDIKGDEVVRVLKSNKKTKDIPLILTIEENAGFNHSGKWNEEGMIDYLLKPFDPEMTKNKVSLLLKINLQKKALAEKQFSLLKAGLLINNSLDIIGIIDPATFKIEEINDSFTSILGYSREEAMDTTLTFFVGREDRKIIEKLAGKNESHLSFETRIYCKDRSIKWLQWNVVSEFGKWFANARDITEIKEVEKIRNYLATVVQQSNDAIYIHDHEGKIISWNEGAEKIYGYSEKEALQMKIRNIIPDYIRLEMDEIMGRIMVGDRIQNLETKRITKFGKIIDVLFSASVITDADTGQKSLAINERDITLQKKADEQIKQLNTDLQKNIVQLEATNKELEFFSYSVSHDLRAPLRALMGYSKILEEDYGAQLDNDSKKYLDFIQHNAQKMGRLIDDLLEFSRLGRKEILKVKTDIKLLVEAVINEINNSARHSAVINIGLLPEAEADYSLLYQVWMNLISNAIKYSSKKERPEVTIGSTHSENEITYFIKDNGAGFNMEYSNKLFGVFQRLHTPAEFEGTGIGLAIVKRVITKHGGRVWAESKEQEGATFYFTLPIRN